MKKAKKKHRKSIGKAKKQQRKTRKQPKKTVVVLGSSSVCYGRVGCAMAYSRGIQEPRAIQKAFLS